MDTIKTWIFDKILGWLANQSQGKKTAIGLLGLIGCYIAMNNGIAVPDWLIKAFESLTAVGVWDKLRRAGNTASGLKKTIDDLKAQIDDLKNSIDKQNGTPGTPV